MPELPEVETWRRLAEKHVAGKRISSVYAVDDPIIFDRGSSIEFSQKLEKRSVISLCRKGKHLWMEMDKGPCAYFHFGMSGSFEVYSTIENRPPFLKAELLMDDDTRLGYVCIRRIGRLRLMNDPLHESPLNRLGFDPLLAMPQQKEFSAAFAERKAPIKSLLLDQSIAAGVGNWIADEILYQARIDPRTKGNELSSEQLIQIRSKMARIIKKAVEVDANSEKFPKTWLFHHRWGKNKAAVTHDGKRIQFDSIGGRTTAWVPCQKV